ncbi:glycerophosphodiester phosphodiesterase [Auraticoccus monumenti]|uniref:Glycerophosphoryl diester phosphodiesterase n=1 Tax=Auraticoccus monumenti TaxID=675864 RepID=A0A1G6XSE5_9ACTN|nr:glycerophosphodiester phosphodiesterase family protein [Auraticoccus monumenti]SDD80891.1 glycerophosphoryl diester phosphodiesterase [Auraticoccus monumenti]
MPSTHARPVRRAAAVLIALAAAGSTVVAGTDVAGAAGRDDVEVIAHRGSSGVAPENTLAAVRLAVRQGSDVIENDVQRTADGALVIMHDSTLTRTTDVEQVFPDRAPWRVGDLTLAEIKQLDAGSWFAPEFAGERVPTLEEWMDAVGRRAGMLLEPKNPALYPGIEQDLDEALRELPDYRRSARSGRIVVQSFDHAWLRDYAEVAPEVRVGLLYGTRPGDADIEAAAEWADQVNPSLAVTTEATVDAVHAEGLEIHVWTVNDGAGMRRATDWDVDGIITNYPQVLIDLQAQG